jgi:hypothetical protein
MVESANQTGNQFDDYHPYIDDGEALNDGGRPRYPSR